MKKELLFVVHGLGIGGIETCLVNLINALPTDKYNIDVLLEYQVFDMKDRIKVPVNFIDGSRFMMEPSETYQAIKQKGGFFKNPSWSIRYLIFRVLVKLNVYNRWTVYKHLPKRYDVAVAYSQDNLCPYYVIDKVFAKKKAMWYHVGVYEYPEKRYKYDLKYYPKFDYIICVSNDNKKVLSSYFNGIDNKLLVLKNISDYDLIREKSNEFVPDNYSGYLNIVTIGRLVEQKRPDFAVDVCKRLINKGYNFRWHWVGDGEDRKEIESQIKEYELENVFILDGNQSNPYPYIEYADIYVQTSRHEAFCTTITEAKTLCKPIVATDVCGVRDQIRDKMDGIICDVSVDAITNAVEELICNPQLRKSFQEELRQSQDTSNNDINEYIETVFS